MTCKNCGTELPESSKFCTKCGTPISAEEMNISTAGVERAVPKGFSAKKNIIIIIIAAILLIGGGITAIAVANSHSTSSGVADKLQLAERYLNEQNYEQAIIEYQKVLEIEPMNVDAYLRIADAYLGMGNKDKALEWLNKGFKQTGDSRVRDRIDELAKPVEPDVSEPEASEPDAPRTSVPETPAYGSMGSVMILGREYDIATTTKLFLGQRNISDEQMKEIAPELAKLTNLWRLELIETQLSDITPLANLTNLTELNLGGNQISDITPLANLTNLKLLYLHSNQISDITPLTNLTNLTELSLIDNQISDITPLTKLTNLAVLELDYNQIKDIMPLANLTKLEYLGLGWNQISNITPLANLTKLEYLAFCGNKIGDIAPLANLTNLAELYFYDNQISDVTPLANLTNLTELVLWGNQISYEDKESLKKQLPNCYMHY